LTVAADGQPADPRGPWPPAPFTSAGDPPQPSFSGCWPAQHQALRVPSASARSRRAGQRTAAFTSPGTTPRQAAATGVVTGRSRVLAQFTALRYSALDGADHASYKEQGSMIRRYVIWRNRHADDTRLRRVVAHADVAW